MLIIAIAFVLVATYTCFTLRAISHDLHAISKTLSAHEVGMKRYM